MTHFLSSLASHILLFMYNNSITTPHWHISHSSTDFNYLENSKYQKSDEQKWIAKTNSIGLAGWLRGQILWALCSLKKSLGLYPLYLALTSDVILTALMICFLIYSKLTKEELITYSLSIRVEAEQNRAQIQEVNNNNNNSNDSNSDLLLFSMPQLALMSTMI